MLVAYVILFTLIQGLLVINIREKMATCLTGPIGRGRYGGHTHSTRGWVSVRERGLGNLWVKEFIGV